jgi:hypothetical protein
VLTALCITGSLGIPIIRKCSSLPGSIIWNTGSSLWYILSISATGCVLTGSTVPVMSTKGPSSATSPVSLPSRMYSAKAGTRRPFSTLLTYTGSFRQSCLRELATSSSFLPNSRFIAAASMMDGQRPMATAIFRSFPWDNALLWRAWRCLGTTLTANLWSSRSIIRWNDMFLMPSCSAMTTPAVTNLPPSVG